MTGDRDVTALQAFKDVLRSLLLAERIAADVHSSPATEPIPYQRFYAELRGAVDATAYRLPHPKTGAIVAAGVLEARGISFEAVALLGLSEGEFPQQEREDPLLRDDERRALGEKGVGLQPRILGDEITLFYEAVTRARHHLLLTRPYLSDDGQPWEPSPYWQEVQQLTGAEPIPARCQRRPRLGARISGGAGTVGRRPTRAFPGRLASRCSTPRPSSAPGRRDMRPAFTKGMRLPSPPACAAISRPSTYGVVAGWRLTQVVAFQFFVGSGLDLEPRTRPEEGFDALILGSIYHAILEEVFRRARNQNDVSEAALRALLQQATEPIFLAAPQTYGFRPTPLWDFQQRELLGVLDRTLVGLSELAGNFAPFEFEAAFGMRGNPPLEITSEEGTLRLRGFIDRIDRNPDGKLRIIDYKSGSTPITAAELAEGKRVQLPLYALAAQQALHLGEVISGFYWHITTAKASSLALEKDPGGVEGALATATAYAFNHVRGIESGRFQPKAPAKGCPASCAAKEFCWRYRPGN